MHSVVGLIEGTDARILIICSKIYEVHFVNKSDLRVSSEEHRAGPKYCLYKFA